jgi:hypothetical protein
MEWEDYLVSLCIGDQQLFCWWFKAVTPAGSIYRARVRGVYLYTPSRNGCHQPMTCGRRLSIVSLFTGFVR